MNDIVYVCQNCNQPCEVHESRREYTDDAYGCPALVAEVTLTSKCCGAEVEEIPNLEYEFMIAEQEQADRAEAE